jgi:hypothetical protein
MTISRLARRQLYSSVAGSSRNSAKKDAQFSRKNDNHRPNIALAPSSIDCNSRPEWTLE